MRCRLKVQVVAGGKPLQGRRLLRVIEQQNILALGVSLQPRVRVFASLVSLDVGDLRRIGVFVLGPEFRLP